VPAPGYQPPAGAGIPGPAGDPPIHPEPTVDDRYDRGHRGSDGYDDHARHDRYGDDGYSDEPYDDGPSYQGPSYQGPSYQGPSYEGHDDEQGGGIGSSLRAARGEAMWRYRSAPLGVRIMADVAAASLVLVLIVGISLALRPDDGPPEATVNRSPVSVATTVTTAATTTTVPPTTTTTVPPTTTTTVPPTTTTAPPVVPPPTEAPTTTVPPTTTTEALRYRDCSEAWFAGALPLFEGDPGYGPHLDRDGDGEACEWDERRRD
jgi:hypothetical protein